MRFRAPIFFCLFFNFIYSQNYSVTSIPKDLLPGADAVVRLDKMNVLVTAQDQMEITSKRVVTVFNDAGNDDVHAYAFYEKNDKISKIEALVYNLNGELIRKFKKKDFLDQSAISGGTLYSDSRVLYLKYTPTEYPYTIEFTKTYSTPNTAFSPTWYFLDDYGVSTEKSEFIYTVDCDIDIRYKESNFEGHNIESENTKSRLHYTAKNIGAIKREPMSPAFREFAPGIKVALSNFHLEGINGSANTWQELGKWIYEKLLVGRGNLDQNTIAKVNNMVKGVEDPFEKTRIVYEYVQSNTRYISVQLGIGGWMPISAQDVDRVKYGDCKGLTNYTKALLSAIGVDSYYTVVYGGSRVRNLDSDFPSMQGNHVFLNVPINGEDVWLECTSQTTPMNHLGMFTDNRNVLKVTPEGGELIKTRANPDEKNYQKTTGKYYITNERNIEGEVEILSKGTQYDQKYRIKDESRKDQDEFYKNYWDYINNVALGDITFTDDKQKIEFTERIQLQAQNYLSSVNEQLILAPNAFNRNLLVPTRVRNRSMEMVISRGYLDEDEYVIYLPEGVSPENLLDPIEVESKFGSYYASLEQVEPGVLKYQRKLLIKSGRYSKEDYKLYRDFRRKVARNDNAKIILNKPLK
ncbi:DUF3857 domain-containing protein [[Muricauda] lutisoli]|uniref:DUF3857 and transglutaminase domain-containing protein n=1 Tax=[Muricauda] lutisoli TaxID=2816035 RepID=A0ABS3EZ35_9FLAO|nr:DUF3857 domain-containing protein [[Muricauda] lutisoli]MBO0331537.1 DUF3857 and transglutaminase domain-containing protein [[Muricauda] lutisoli]